MAKIQTVLGSISPKDLGITLMHEHLQYDALSFARNPDCRLDEADVIDDALDLKRAGGSALVEMTCIGLGTLRDIKSLKRISEKTGLHVIASTGFYKEHELDTTSAPFKNFPVKAFPPIVYEKTIDELADIITKEILEGREGTIIKAGIIKGGTSLNQVTNAEEKTLRAEARAYLETGASISTHTSLGTMGLKQLDIYEDEGVDLTRVIIGHCDLKPDLTYHEAIAKRGAYIGYDTVGKEKYQPDGKRVELVVNMVKRGYTNQILLSTDRDRKSQLKKYGGIGYSYLLESFVPRLKKARIDENDIHTILVENPREILQF